MKNKKMNAVVVWKQIEDWLVPGLALSVADRAVYCRLVRHSRLEGKSRLRFSIRWLASGVRLTAAPVRNSLRRLAANGALRIIERSKAGHVAELRLPEEMRGTLRGEAPSDKLRAAMTEMHGGRSSKGSDSGPVGIEELDFMRSRHLRRAIHARERGQCFYCLRRVARRMQCLDHVHPRAQMGLNSYRNLVSCCLECNARKGETAAKDFLRWLYRAQKLSASEFEGRLRALEDLRAGKLRAAVIPASKAKAQRDRAT